MSTVMSWPFIRLYLLVILYFSANSILNVIIPLQGEMHGASNTTIGIIMGAYLFTTMFFRPWAGRIIQVHGPLKVLRIILLFNAVALLLYPFTGLAGYFIARVIQGVATAFFSMSLQLGIIDALPEKDRSQGISLYSLFSYIPGIIGPLLALGIWQGGMHSFSVVMIGIAICTGVIGYGATIQTKAADQSSLPNNPEQTRVMTSFSQVVKNPFLRKCSIIMLGASIVFGATTTFIPLYAMQITNGNAGIYLMLQAGTVVIARFTLQKMIPSDGNWHSYFIMGAMLLLTVGAQCISFSINGGVLFFYSGAVLMGIAQAIIYPTLTTYLSFVLPSHTRNVLLGLFIATADLGVSLGSVLMGPLADLFTYATMYQICALLCMALLIFAYEWRKVELE